MKKRMTRLLLLVCVFCIMLTGCGVNVDTHENELQPPVSASSDSGEETSSQTTASEPATTVPDTQKPAESTQPPEQTTEPPVTETQAPPTTEPTQPENSTFSVHFIDVGQADAALIECDGHYMLIDGGNKGDSNVIYSVLKKAGADHLDIVVGTHGHEDHIGGLPGAFNYATADLTLCPVTSYDSDAFDDFAKYANKSGGGITITATASLSQPSLCVFASVTLSSDASRPSHAANP